MRVPTVIVGRQGRLTLPKELIRGLRLKAEAKLNFDLKTDGFVIVSTALSTTGAPSPRRQQAGPEGESA